MARVRGLKLDDGIEFFDFKPSVGIVAAKVDKLGLDIRSWREPLKRSVQQVMGPSFQKNFDAGGRPDRWAELAPYTLQRHQEEGGSGQPLVKSGKLKKTMGQLNIWHITENAASLQKLTGDTWYGGIHQAGHGQFESRVKKFGGDVKAALEDLDNALKGGDKFSAGIPARPFVLIQDEDYDAIEKVFSDWLDERIARTWATGAGRI